MTDLLLSVRQLSKSFNGVRVLTDVSLDLRSGEVHGLVGQNGSGKSTVIKCLSGYHAPDPSWELQVGGKTITRGLLPGEPGQLGISFVHQDLGLIGDMTVLENLLIHRFGQERRPYIAWRREHRAARALLESFGLEIDPRTPLRLLRPVEQAHVAIVRALVQLEGREPGSGRAPGVLVLDEATTFLDRAGRESLHALLRAIAGSGSAVLFVSHDVDEVLTLADRVTVLRDGRVVETAESTSLTTDDIVGLIVGGRRDVRLEDQFAPAAASEAHVGTTGGPSLEAEPLPEVTAATTPGRLVVRDLTGPLVSGVGFEAEPGEILGVTGIVGAGWEQVPDHLYGSQPVFDGWLEIGGTTIPLASMTPIRALEEGMVLVPSERLVQGIIPGTSVEENVMLPVLGRSFRGGRLRRRELTRRCGALLRRHAVQPPHPHQPIGTLSGGNQQKAVLAKWFQLQPRVILLNEPTQGVDVGARQLIFRQIQDAAQRGAVVLYASSDWEEVCRIADRVVVVADGRVAEVLAGSDVDVERVASAAYRGTRRSADMTRATAAWAAGS